MSEGLQASSLEHLQVLVIFPLRGFLVPDTQSRTVPLASKREPESLNAKDVPGFP